jgi:hypothetical protein
MEALERHENFRTQIFLCFFTYVKFFYFIIFCWFHEKCLLCHHNNGEALMCAGWSLMKALCKHFENILVSSLRWARWTIFLFVNLNSCRLLKVIQGFKNVPYVNSIGKCKLWPEILKNFNIFYISSFTQRLINESVGRSQSTWMSWNSKMSKRCNLSYSLS